MVKCELCNKEFETEESLQQHKKVKHQVQEKEPKIKFTQKQKRKIRNWSILIAVIGLISWGIFAIVSNVESCQEIPAKELTLSAHTNAVIHIHPKLTIFVEGKQQLIPANIGVESNFMRALHTHDASGTLHIESPCSGRTDFTLGEFFEVWGEGFYKEGMKVRMLVNGEENAELDKYIMRNHDDIKLEYASL